MTGKNQITGGGAKWGLAGAVVAGIAASVCCVGPLLLMLLGISGAWIGNLTAFEPYRPIFIATAAGFLGFAFYKTYSAPKAEACEPGSVCASPRAGRFNRIILWMVTILTFGLLFFPYAVPYVFAESSEAQPQAKEVTLDVRNMTCPSCLIPVKMSLKKLDGVKDVKVTIRPPRAVVTYDPSKVTMKEMTTATTNAGYPSTVAGAPDAK